MRTHYETVYAALGRLFYAVAASDGRIAPAEQRILVQLIKDRWLPLEESRDPYGTDAAHYIGIAFDHAVDKGMDLDEAFAAFTDALAEHPSLFTDAVRTLTWETAHAIALAIAGESDAEQEQLARLGQVLHGKPSHA
jgi:hypothetical protein